MSITKLSGLAAAFILGIASQSVAQSAGELEYLDACSACHGASGLGDGAVAGYMSVEVPDLRRLSAGNDGEFPMLEVIAMIDGRSEVGAHGREMPVWGRRYMQEAPEVATGFAAELFTRGEVLALADYLQSIQN